MPVRWGQDQHSGMLSGGALHSAAPHELLSIMLSSGDGMCCTVNCCDICELSRARWIGLCQQDCYLQMWHRPAVRSTASPAIFFFSHNSTVVEMCIGESSRANGAGIAAATPSTASDTSGTPRTARGAASHLSHRR